jgi:hypothetical protein
MGTVYWKAEPDPENPDFVILTKTDSAVEDQWRVVLERRIEMARRREALRQQAKKLKGLRGEASTRRLARIMAIAEQEPEVKTDEQRVADAAAELIGRMESELEQ